MLANFDLTPLLIFLGSAFLIFSLMFFGRQAFALFKFFDGIVTSLLHPFARLVGATQRPRGKREVWMRRGKILAWLLPLLGLCAFLIYHTPEGEGPQKPTDAWAWLELAAVCFLYLTALSIAKQWLANEGALFDLEDTKDDERAGVVANHLKRVAMFSLFIVLICVPISLHACHRCFGWGVGLKDFVGCVNLSLEMLADSLLNLGSLLNISDKSEPGKEGHLDWVIFFHVLVLTFIVIEGFLMMARGDYAMRLALRSLIRERNTDKVVPFGERVKRKLFELLVEGRHPEHPKQDNRTSEERRTNSADAAISLGKIAENDGYLSSDIVDLLVTVALNNSIRNEGIRKAALEALYGIGLAVQDSVRGHPPGLLDNILEKIKIIAFKRETRAGVRTAALVGLKKLRGLSNQEEMNQTGEIIERDTCTGVRRAAAECLAAHKNNEVALQANARVIGILSRAHGVETDAKVRASMAHALRAIAPTVVREELIHHNEQLEKGSIPERTESAAILGESIEDETARCRLIRAVQDESDQVQTAVAKALGEGERLLAASKRREIIEAIFRLFDPGKRWNVQIQAVNALKRFRMDPVVKSKLAARVPELRSIKVIAATTRALGELGAIDELIDLLPVTEFEVHSNAQAALRSLFKAKSWTPEIIEEIGTILDGLDAASTTLDDRRKLKDLVARAHQESLPVPVEPDQLDFHGALR